MSYDIHLKSPVTEEVIELPYEHVMTGGTYPATYNASTGTFTVRPTNDAHLNITYNYSRYYYEATEGDPRFAHDEVSAYYADGTTGPIKTEYGIRGLYGKSGAESIPMLHDMISKIRSKYKYDDGEWMTTTRDETYFVDKDSGQELDYFSDIFGKNRSEDSYEKKDRIIFINEGDTSDYWRDTAANAIIPLYQLIAMAQLRPDGVWDGD